MAFDNRGAQWIQEAETIENPYFGAAMRTCGSIEEVVEPGSFLPADPAAPPVVDPDPAPSDGSAAPRRPRAAPAVAAPVPSGSAPAPRRPPPDPHAGHGGR
jgi:hypothetical protein